MFGVFGGWCGGDCVVDDDVWICVLFFVCCAVRVDDEGSGDVGEVFDVFRGDLIGGFVVGVVVVDCVVECGEDVKVCVDGVEMGFKCIGVMYGERDVVVGVGGVVESVIGLWMRRVREVYVYE